MNKQSDPQNIVTLSHEGLIAKMNIDVSLKMGETKNTFSPKKTNIKAATNLNIQKKRGDQKEEEPVSS